LAIKSVGIRSIITIAIHAHETITGIATATDTVAETTIVIHAAITGAGVV